MPKPRAGDIDPALIILYSYLLEFHKKLISAMVDPIVVPPADEHEFFVSCMRGYERVGCHALALELISQRQLDSIPLVELRDLGADESVEAVKETPKSDTIVLGEPEIKPETGLDWGEPEVKPSTGLDWGELESKPSGGLDWGELETKPSGGLDWGELETKPSTGLDWGELETKPSGGLDWNELGSSEVTPEPLAKGSSAFELTPSQTRVVTPEEYRRLQVFQIQIKEFQRLLVSRLLQV